MTDNPKTTSEPVSKADELPRQTTKCPKCGGALCSLCVLLAHGWGMDTTPAQDAAIEAFMSAESDDNDGAEYQAMVAAGLPAWGVML